MAIEFASASSEYIALGTTPLLDLSGAFSIVAWVRPNDTNTGIIYAEGNSGDDDPECMLLVTPATSFRGIWRNDTGGGEITVTGASPPVGVWSHICVTRTGTTFTPYLNGAAGSPATLTMPSPVTRNLVALGIFNRLIPASPYDGQIEDARVYNRLLTAEEVAVLAAGYRGPLGGEVGWWTLNDAQVVTHWDGDSLATTDVIPDMSGNGNDGTPTNTPTARASEAPRVGAMLG